MGTNLLSKLGYYLVQASEESSNCNALDASVHKLDDRESKVDATVPELAQQNGDDCDIPVISVYKSDNGDGKVDATVPELAQQNVDISGASVNNSGDKQDKVDTAVLNIMLKVWRLKLPA